MAKEDFLDRTFTASQERCRQTTALILGYVNAELELRVLDLGCGTGAQLFDLAAALPRAWLLGVDVADVNIRAARQTVVGHPGKDRLDFVTADYLDYRDDPFDPDHIGLDDSEHRCAYGCAFLQDKLGSSRWRLPCCTDTLRLCIQSGPVACPPYFSFLARLLDGCRRVGCGAASTWQAPRSTGPSPASPLHVSVALSITTPKRCEVFLDPSGTYS